MAKCSAKTRAGTPCRAPRIRGTKFCVTHTPGKASEMGKVGGPRRRLLDPTHLFPFTPPESAEDFARLLAQTAIEVREAKLPSKVANSLAIIATAFLACLKHGDLEKRLIRVERHMGVGTIDDDLEAGPEERDAE